MQLQTRHTENRFVTSDLEEMKGKYLTKRILRSWTEDFVDEDTGETVQIERKEIILDRGTYLDSTTLQTVNFHLSSGDIDSVEVSDQKREGVFTSSFTSIWCVTALIGSKKKNIYLYSDSVFNSLEIATDYIEQLYQGSFQISSVKELDYANLVTNISQENEGELKFYKVEIEIEKDDEHHTNIFILKAFDAENAKSLIGAYLSQKFAEEDNESEFNLRLQSAKTIPCEAVINEKFCLKYIKSEEDAEAH